MQLDNIEQLLETSLVAIAHTQELTDLEDLRVAYLGKSGSFTALTKQISQLDKQDLPIIGKQINQAKGQVTAAIGKHKQVLLKRELDNKLASESIDISLPGIYRATGKQHPIIKVQQQVIDFFATLGFSVATGPEIEDDYHNFTALNIPDHHPARAMHDTFYLDKAGVKENLLLRTHTSSVQVRVMANNKPPLRIIAPGKVYRCDSDITHTPMFHQVEGLLIDEQVSLADLKGVVTSFLCSIFKTDIGVRFRPSYFPFTEPSMEVDIGCIMCESKGCRICKDTGWLEIMGCGLVHPQVFNYANIDSAKFSGYAFGIGIERLAMLLYGVSDLRLFFENNVKFLEQF
jgi:phenylalanyl-tRNA synthetase alpha chain